MRIRTTYLTVALFAVLALSLVTFGAGDADHGSGLDVNGIAIATDIEPTLDPNGIRIAEDHGSGLDVNGACVASDHGSGLDVNGTRGTFA